MAFGAAGASARISVAVDVHAADAQRAPELRRAADDHHRWGRASHALIAHLDKLAPRRGYQLVYSGGWALTGREKAALRLVPEQGWQAAIDSRGKIRERRADDACGISQCAHRPCRLRGARSNLRPRLARGITTSPLPVAHAARRKPRTWPTTKSGP